MSRTHPESSAVFHFDVMRSEEHTSELQSHSDLVCRLLLEKKKLVPRDAVSPRCRRGVARPDGCRHVAQPQAVVAGSDGRRGPRCPHIELSLFFFLRTPAPPNSNLFPHPGPFPL